MNFICKISEPIVEVEANRDAFEIGLTVSMNCLMHGQPVVAPNWLKNGHRMTLSNDDLHVKVSLFKLLVCIWGRGELIFGISR